MKKKEQKVKDLEDIHLGQTYQFAVEDQPDKIITAKVVGFIRKRDWAKTTQKEGHEDQIDYIQLEDIHGWLYTRPVKNSGLKPYNLE